MIIEDFDGTREAKIAEILDGYEFDAYVEIWDETIQVDGDLSKTDIEMLAKIAEALF